MPQNLDKNKIRDSIQKARTQDLLYLTNNPADKDSKREVMSDINNFFSKDFCEILIIKKVF